jgi:hypothetical protein
MKNQTINEGKKDPKRCHLFLGDKRRVFLNRYAEKHGVLTSQLVQKFADALMAGKISMADLNQA